MVRTKTELRGALRELMTKRRWDKIRVQDILDLTGISRSAFYSHFDGKYDLLVSRIPDVEIDFSNPAGDGIDLTPFFAHVDEMSDIMRPLLTQPVLGDIMADFHRALTSSWREYLGLDANPVGVEWVLPDMLAGSLLAVAKSYLLERDRTDPATVAEEFETHLNAMLRAFSTATNTSESTR